MNDADFGALESEIRAFVKLQDFRDEAAICSLLARLRHSITTFPRDQRLKELGRGFENLCHEDYIKSHKLQRFLDGLVEIVVTTRSTDPIMEIVNVIDKRGVE